MKLSPETLAILVIGATVVAIQGASFFSLRGEMGKMEDRLRGEMGVLRGEITRVEAGVLENRRRITALVREVSELRGELKGRDLLSEEEDR